MPSDDRDEWIVGDADVTDFAELVAELALSYADEGGSGPRPTLVEQIVAGAAVVIPGVISASVETLDLQGALVAPVMAGDDVARLLMDAQNRAGDGPCLSALRDHKQVWIPDLHTDSRWPDFAAVATARGVRAVVCTPMEVNRRGVGALVLVSDRVDFADVSDDTQALARVFAAHAGLALTGARRAVDMNAALSSREVIGQAKGILMERFGVAPDVAFAVLVRASSRTNTKLRTVCENLCRTGILPEHGGPNRSTRPAPRTDISPTR